MGFYHNCMSMFYHSLCFLKPQQKHNNTAQLCATVAYRSLWMLMCVSMRFYTPENALAFFAFFYMLLYPFGCTTSNRPAQYAQGIKLIIMSFNKTVFLIAPTCKTVISRLEQMFKN